MAIASREFVIMPSSNLDRIQKDEYCGENLEPILALKFFELGLQHLENLSLQWQKNGLNHDLIQLRIHYGCDWNGIEPRTVSLLNTLNPQGFFTTNPPRFFYETRSHPEPQSLPKEWALHNVSGVIIVCD